MITYIICFPRLSFALSANQIKEKARVVAMDLRGHGRTTTENDNDLSIETLCNDVQAVVKAIYGDSPPAIVLVGHSMGGSVAVHVAANKILPSLNGLVIVDVVEGTAMASLIHMQKILSGRTHHFSSIEKAIESTIKGGSLRNIESARLSVPTTLKYDDSKKWYEGLSEKFLSSPVPKLLLLAGTDRLDRFLGFIAHPSLNLESDIQHKTNGVVSYNIHILFLVFGKGVFQLTNWQWLPQLNVQQCIWK